MKMLNIDRFRLFYGLWLVLVVGGCSWAATPPPTPTPVPPPPGKLVFSTTHDRGRTREIYMMGTDGSNPMNLTQSPTDDFQPAWAPDGRHIVFVSNRYRQSQLLIMNVETRETYRVKGPIAPGTNLDLLQQDFQPAWSPDGEWIVYTSSPPGAGGTDIFKIRIDGTEETQLTNHRAPDFQPAWSPDGRQIAFVSWRVSNPRESYLAPYEANIYIMNADGTNVRRFTDDRETKNEAPLWSQDGQWIAYHVMDGPGQFTRKLILQNVATHEKRILRESEYLGILSDQSPDGAWLVFDELRFDGSTSQICFIQISGQNYQCLTPPGLQTSVIYARWQPAATP